MSKPPLQTRASYHVGNLAEKLLEAAQEMLEEVGPTKLSLRAVSERVGVSSTAAYHHFASRAELTGQLAARGFRGLQKVLAVRDTQDDNMQKLRRVSLAYFSFARRNPALYQLMFGPEFASGDMPHELRLAREQAFAELKQIVADILQKDIGSSDVNKAALAGWSYTHGLASLVIHGVLSFPEGTTDERFLDSTLNGFAMLFSSR